MNTPVETRYEIDVEDVEYLRHGNKPLLMRLFKPRGTGPFPLVIDLHGGAWCRGERGALPPVPYLQGTADVAHPRPNLDRFVAAYRKTGGRVELKLFDGVGEAFVKKDPKSSASIACIDTVIEFVHRELS